MHLAGAMVFVSVTMLVVLAIPVRADDGAGAVTMTQTFKDATQSFTGDVNPCTGGTGIFALTFNGVFHITYLTSGVGAGTFWATGTMEGTFVFTPDDPSQAIVTGHFASWFGENSNLNNGAVTATFTAHGTGSDGSTIAFHDVMHVSLSATGITNSFDKPSLTCG